jgi:hypothetical protein
VLTELDLPESELHAATLDGELFRVGAGFCPVDELESPRHRALSLTALLPSRMIAERRTAAWVLGLRREPPAPLELCALSSERSRAVNPAGAIVREVVIEDAELMRVGGLRLTNPLRTVLDLARVEEDFGDEERRLVADLARLGGFGLAECAASVRHRRNLPAVRRALDRIAASLAAAGERSP